MRLSDPIAAFALAALLGAGPTAVLSGAGAAMAGEGPPTMPADPGGGPGSALPPALPPLLPDAPPDTSPDQDQDVGEAAPPDAATSDTTTSAGAAERARAAHIDALFAELADPANENWQSVQSQIYTAWSHSGSASMDLLAQRADMAMEAQDMDTALSFLNDLVRLAPDHAEGWNKRATIYFLQEDYSRSLEDIARVLTLEPRHFGAYAGLGIILDRLGDDKGALEAYRRAAAIHPHLPGATEGIRKLTRKVEGERT